MTEETLRNLDIAWSYDCTDEEGCLLADISPKTLYTYQEKHPEYLQRKKALKHQPVLHARRTVVEALKKDSRLAMDYLARKKKDEFAPSTETNVNVNVTGYVHSGDMIEGEEAKKLTEGEE